MRESKQNRNHNNAFVILFAEIYNLFRYGFKSYAERRQMFRASFSIVLVVLALTACSTAPTRPPSKASVAQIGYVNLTDYRAGSDSRRDASAFFERVTEKQGDSAATEGCSIFDGDEELPVTLPELIDAGPSITLSAEKKPYATLNKLELDNGDIIYQIDSNPVFGSLPPVPKSGLSVTVPGASFPDFSNVAMPSPPPAFVPDNLADTKSLTIESRITWKPALPTMSDTLSLVGFTAFLLRDSSVARLQCVLEDDGDFTFTGEVRAVLIEKGLSAGYFSEFVRYFERTEVRKTGQTVAKLLLSTLTVTN